MSTPDSSHTDDRRTYDGPDSDIAAGNITDADFAADASAASPSGDATDADEETDADRGA